MLRCCCCNLFRYPASQPSGQSHQSPAPASLDSLLYPTLAVTLVYCFCTHAYQPRLVSRFYRLRLSPSLSLSLLPLTIRYPPLPSPPHPTLPLPSPSSLLRRSRLLAPAIHPSPTPSYIQSNRGSVLNLGSFTALFLATWFAPPLRPSCSFHPWVQSSSSGARDPRFRHLIAMPSVLFRAASLSLFLFPTRPLTTPERLPSPPHPQQHLLLSNYYSARDSRPSSSSDLVLPPLHTALASVHPFRLALRFHPPLLPTTSSSQRPDSSNYTHTDKLPPPPTNPLCIY